MKYFVALLAVLLVLQVASATFAAQPFEYDDDDNDENGCGCGDDMCSCCGDLDIPHVVEADVCLNISVIPQTLVCVWFLLCS
jgi:hypothetical protein